MIDRKQVEELVRNKVAQAVAANPPKSGSASASATKSVSTSLAMGAAKPLDFVNEAYIAALDKNTVKTIYVTPKATITPSARDAAERMHLEFKIAVGETVVSEKATPDAPKNPKSIAIGADHGGFEMKELLKKEMKNWGYEVYDVGTNSTDSVDYPDFAHPVAVMVSRGECAYGIIVDGAGIGSAMVANKVPGVRAANCHDIYEVKNSKEHNNANVLTLGGKTIGIGLATEMLRIWLETPFGGGRHQKRVDKIMLVEKLYCGK